MRKVSFEKCILSICNQIIADKTFQDSEFLLHLNNSILEASYSTEIIHDLYFCYTGLLCRKKEYINCFEALHAWSKDFSHLTPKMRAYLTLAELNAYEIDGCGNFLRLDDYNEKNASNKYLKIANRIFTAVENQDRSEILSTILDYSELINPKNDGLLKALCDGITEIFEDRTGSGLLSSLFGK